MGSLVLFHKHDPADLIRDLWDVRDLTIAENNNCGVVGDVTPDFGDKAINSATVADCLVVVHLSNEPTVAVAQAKSGYLRMLESVTEDGFLSRWPTE